VCISVSEIKKKLHGLRTQLSVELRKRRAVLKSGSGGDVAVKRPWKFYDELSFLQDYVAIQCTSTYSNLPATTWVINLLVLYLHLLQILILSDMTSNVNVTYVISTLLSH